MAQVFISYKKEDVDFAENLSSRLEREGSDVWADSKIAVGEEWRNAIDVAIGNSVALIVIMTPEAKASEYVTYEWAFAWGIGIKVIPVMLRPTTLHPRLEALQYLDFTNIKSRPWDKLIDEVRAVTRHPRPEETISPGDRVTNMTVEQLQKLITGAVSLVRAGEERSAPEDQQAGDVRATALDAAGRVLRAADATSQIGDEPGDIWRRRILWVDDRPDNNTYERQVFESLGLTFDLALSTSEALERLSSSRYGAIISDMGRREGPREGYRLLDAVRSFDIITPFFIYASSNAPEHRQEAAEHGAQGSTNRANELVDMVTRALSGAAPRATGSGPRATSGSLPVSATSRRRRGAC
jgi:CheY-like chemotaxis protein